MRDFVSFVAYLIFCIGFYGIVAVSLGVLVLGILQLSWYGLAWAIIFWAAYFALLAAVVLVESNAVARFLWGKVLRGEVSNFELWGGERVKCSIDGFSLYIVSRGGEHGTEVRDSSGNVIYSLRDNLRVSNLTLYWVLWLRATNHGSSPDPDISLLRKYKE